MDRNDWRASFQLSEGERVPWPCPRCAQRALIVQNGTVWVEEGADSKEAHLDEDWEPEWTERRFVCLLACTCGERIAVAGIQNVLDALFESRRGETYSDYIDVSTPLYFQPALRIIRVADAVPSGIRDEMDKSFKVFWCDLESCANRIRASVERLMDDRGIAKTYVSRGKRRTLALHLRIQRYASGGGVFGDALMAVKWLGNAGSHSAPMTRDDVFDGYDIMDHVLREIFEQPAKRIARIAGTINRSRKPRSVSSRTRRRS